MSTELPDCISVPELCKTHQLLLLDQAGYKEEDPWQALFITTMLALFQAVTTRDDSFKKIDYDIKKLPELGCLACERPDSFGEIVEAAKSHNLQDIKRLGDQWLDECAFNAMRDTMNINELATEIYIHNVKVGWWDNPDRCSYQTMQLISTEVAEATEGERKDMMDDHLPTRKMGEVELADALIRTLDLAGRYGLKYKNNIPPHNWCIEDVSSIGKQHLGLNACIINLAISFELNEIAYGKEHTKYSDDLNMFYSRLVTSILHVAFRNGYDIKGATLEKHEYNKTRADHKREEREKEHGKSF